MVEKLIEEIERSYDELNGQLSDPVVLNDHKLYTVAARRHAELARDLGDPRAYVVLGRLALNGGRLSEALQVIDEGLKRFRSTPPAGLHVLRAEVFGRQERLAEAEAEYQLEVEAHPRSLDALSGLAIVAASRGDIAEASRRIDTMVRTLPTPEGYLTGFASLRSFGRLEQARVLLAEGRRAFPLDARLAREESSLANPGRAR